LIATPFLLAMTGDVSFIPAFSRWE
jgi:hypothetical protein